MRLRWDYLLVLEILLQGNAARHDGCELDEVHKICAGVFGQVFFDDLASKKANPSDNASDGRGVDYRLHELVVRHGEVYLGFLRFVLGLFCIFGFQLLEKLFSYCVIVIFYCLANSSSKGEVNMKPRIG